MKKLLLFILILALMLSLYSGCRQNDFDTVSVSSTGSTVTTSSTDSGDGIGNLISSNTDNTSGSSAESETADSPQTDTEMFTNRDSSADYNEGSCVSIQLNGTSATASSNSVRISGNTVTLTEEATYIVSGSLDNGMIVVDADKTAKLQIVLDGVTIHSETSAALYILNADKVFVTLADGSQNVLSNGGSFEAIDENNIDGTVFSKQDLTFNGSGNLNVSSPAGHGIVCKDDLVFTSGAYTVAAASHGLDANDSVRVADASITITAGKDGIHSENTDDASLGFVYISSGSIHIEAEGDGIDAGAYLQIQDGTINLLTGGGSINGSKAASDFFGKFMGGNRPDRFPQSTAPTDNDSSSTSMKGLKAAGKIQISGGTISIDSADDAIHSDTSIDINGGTFEIASGDDGVHAEDTLTVTACTMNISESYEGLEAQKVYVKGGTIILNSTDDGLNAAGGTDFSGTMGGRDGMFGGGKMPASSNGEIEISGGNLTIYASGDGLDANGSLLISGGYIYVANPTAGDTSVLDSDADPIITGGTFISTGSTTRMAQTFSSWSTQGVITSAAATQSAGASVTVKDSSGNTLISYDVEYPCVLVIISSPDIVKGETYTLSVGSASGNVTAN